MHRQTDKWTDIWTDKVIPILPPPSKQNLTNFVCGGYKYVVAMNKTHDILNTLTINSFIKNMYQVKGAGQRRVEKCLLLQCHVLLMIYLCFTHTFLISM